MNEIKTTLYGKEARDLANEAELTLGDEEIEFDAVVGLKLDTVDGRPNIPQVTITITSE